MSAWVVSYRVTEDPNRPSLAFGVAIISGSTLASAMRAAEVELRKSYPAPKARIILTDPVPSPPEDRKSL